MSTATVSLESNRKVWATWRVLAHHLVRCGYSFGSCYPGSPIVPTTASSRPIRALCARLGPDAPGVATLPRFQ